MNKVLAAHARGCGFDPQKPFEKEGQAWLSVLAILVLEKQRQVDAWGLLASQLSLDNELQVQNNVHGF